MKNINRVSAWASRNPRQAIPSLVLLEFANIAIGIMVGSALLKDFSPWVLMALILGMVLINSSLKRYAQVRLVDLVSQARFGFQKKVFFGLFCINLCAYTVAGGIMGGMVDHPDASINLYGSITTTSTVNASSEGEKKMSLREKIRQKTFSHTNPKANDTGRRVGYIALFLLGVGLAIVGAYLACAAACSGVGFGAVLILLLSTGVLAGGVYFLGRGVAKTVKPFKEMTQEERKREKRRYGWTFLATLGGVALLLLLAISGG